MLAASIHIASPDGGDSKAAVSPRSSGFHFLSPLRHVVGAVRRLTARLQGDSDDEDLGERANLYAGDVIEGEGGLHDVRFKIAKKLGEGRFSSVFSAESMLVRGAGGNNGNGGGNGTNGGPSNLGPARACSPSNTNGGSTSTLLSIPGEAEAKKRVRDQKASSSSANGELQLYPIDDHVIHESIPPVVAVKALRSQASLDEMQGEISVLRSCHGCPYIIDFYGFAHFHFMGTDPHKCLLLELAHSDLHSMVQKGLTVQNKNVIRQIGPQMHDALLFLKKNSYVHLDLKLRLQPLKHRSSNSIIRSIRILGPFYTSSLATSFLLEKEAFYLKKKHPSIKDPINTLKEEDANKAVAPMKPENVVVMPPRHWNAMDRKAAVSGKKKMQLGISNSERGGDDDVYFQDL
ncbi:unnamed protein product [Amoebophrya sp. A25]|nr:unnamed protein product [Amoebophrya sp. A25]|eukprot:GSA25T00023262001.1